jgi:hypothetical protein
MSAETQERTILDEPELMITAEQKGGSLVKVINLLKDQDPEALTKLLEQIPNGKLMKLFADRDFLLTAIGSEREVEAFRQNIFRGTLKFYGRTVNPRYYAYFTRLITSRPVRRMVWGAKAEQRINELTHIQIVNFQRSIERSANGHQR